MSIYKLRYLKDNQINVCNTMTSNSRTCSANCKFCYGIQFELCIHRSFWNRVHSLFKFNPNSLDNKGSCWILKDFYCSVTMLLKGVRVNGPVPRYSTCTHKQIWLCDTSTLSCCASTGNFGTGYPAAFMVWFPGTRKQMGGKTDFR